jgi:putative copper export protein
MARLVVVWLHVVAAAAWVGGILYAGHLVVPAAGRGARDALALLRRGRVVSWAAVALLLVTGLENLRSAAVITPWLAGKLVLVIAVLALAAHRDFGALPRAARAIDQGSDPGRALAVVRTLDRAVLVLALAVLFLAVGIARGR